MECLSLLDSSFVAAESLPSRKLCTLSGALLDELVLVSVLALVYSANLRSPPLHELFAFDASEARAGGCRVEHCVFNYLHDSNSIFRARGINSEICFGRTVIASSCTISDCAWAVRLHACGKHMGVTTTVINGAKRFVFGLFLIDVTTWASWPCVSHVCQSHTLPAETFAVTVFNFCEIFYLCSYSFRILHLTALALPAHSSHEKYWDSAQNVGRFFMVFLWYWEYRWSVFFFFFKKKKCVLRGTQRTLTGVPPRCPMYRGIRTTLGQHNTAECRVALRAVNLHKQMAQALFFVVVERDSCDLAFRGVVVLSFCFWFVFDWLHNVGVAATCQSPVSDT